MALMAAFDRAPPWVQEALQQPNGMVIVPKQLALPAPPPPPAAGTGGAKAGPPPPAAGAGVESADGPGTGPASAPSAYDNFHAMRAALDDSDQAVPRKRRKCGGLDHASNGQPMETVKDDPRFKIRSNGQELTVAWLHQRTLRVLLNAVPH